jgi:hypothetical protein
MNRFLPVRGAVCRRGATPLLVLSDRLDGRDTFLRADLALDPDGVQVRVRVHTFDDVTVLRPSRDDVITDRAHGEAWSGRLRLPPDRRPGAVPDDLAEALAAAGLPIELDALDERQRRHLLGYLADAKAPAVRQARIVTIMAALVLVPAAE